MASRTFSNEFKPLTVGIVPASSTKTITAPSGSNGIFIAIGASTRVALVALYSVTSAGAITLVPLLEYDQLTLTINGVNTINITNSATGTNPILHVLMLIGNAPTMA